MSERHVPRLADLRPLLRRRRLPLRPTDRRLGQAHTIIDLRRIAARRTPRSAFDYTDGAAEQEVSLRRARQAFDRVRFHPAVMRDVSSVDTGTTVLGRRWPLPFALAPTGFTRLMQHEGERAAVRAADRADVTYALSTMGTTSVEDVAAAAPGAHKWFQLYVWRDREAGNLIQRAWDCGYEALIVTVDTPVAGARMRDVRNGFTIPPTLTPKTVADIALHPAWWFNLLTTEPLTFASIHQWGGTIAELVNQMFDPSVTFADLAWMRDAWPGPLVVKGIQNTPDAVAAVEHGADAVVVSNHGGRQLDRTVAPLELLPEVVDAVGERVDVLLDSGILRGGDVAAGLALGARACLVGRAYLYGLMAGGERGVDRAIGILAEELSRTLQLLGVRSVEELDRSHVSLRS